MGATFLLLVLCYPLYAVSILFVFIFCYPTLLPKHTNTLFVIVYDRSL